MDFDLGDVLELGMGIALGSLILAAVAYLFPEPLRSLTQEAAGPTANRIVTDNTDRA
jgi:hypothetical protein